MTNSPKVSVLLSAYNPRYLRPALESILNQTISDFEFIIIDDSVTPETQAVLSHYASQDKRILVKRNESNLGQTRSLNAGLAMARGDYISRQDDDDISHPDRLRQQVEFLDSHPEIGLLGTQVDIITDETVVIDGQQFFHPLVGSADVTEQLYLDNCLCHGSVMFRRQLAANGMIYDAALAPADDYDLWLHFVQYTKAGRLDQHLYQYRYYPDSVSERNNHRQLHFKALALERALLRRFGATLRPPWSAALARHYQRAAVSNLNAGDAAVSRACLIRALTLDPKLFEPLSAYLPLTSDDTWAQAELIFAELPRTPQHESVTKRLRSRLHMQQVFFGLRSGDLNLVDRHIWAGIRTDPAWLLNRGVIATLVRSLLRSVRSARTLPG